MIVRRYLKSEDEEKLFELLKKEGEEWSCYWKDQVSDKYKTALHDSIAYVAYEGDLLCGYCRALYDCEFYIYVCDLLVTREQRGKSIGRKLMDRLCEDWPDHMIYVMSDVDEYYEKQGYKKAGSIYEITKEK
ncbi:MAG TPA: GNAT family N-acetyltransferase [Bacillota bacterium]|nr:GNAT family N-acetyltransferase [Bacillota bacterium]